MTVVLVLLAWAAAGFVRPARAVPPAHSKQTSAVQMPEFVEMLTAVLFGSQMGPGDGWFHPSQSRYGWKWLAGRYDANRDGRIGRKEFTGPADLFNALDRDHDGELTPADFDWSDNSPYARQGMAARMWFSRMDADSNGRVSKKEWEQLFKRAAKGKDYLTADDLRDAFPLGPPPRPKDAPPPSQQGPSPATLLRGLFNGELGSPFPGPRLGDPAPDFTLPEVNGKGEVRLSQFRGRKPVVLVFGSFT